MAHITRFAATDEPDPLLDVPAERSVSYGLQLTPPNGLREMPDPTLAFAMMIAPASRIRLIKVASRGGRSLAYATSAPAVVRMSNVSYQSLTAYTVPCSGPTSLPVVLKYASCFAAISSASGMSGLLSRASVMLRALWASRPSATRLAGRRL